MVIFYKLTSITFKNVQNFASRQEATEVRSSLVFVLTAHF